MPQGRRYVLRDHLASLDLGRPAGNHPITHLGGALAQLARRLGTVLYLVMLGLLLFVRPHGAYSKAAVITGVALVLAGLSWTWRRIHARFGINRCYLYARGFVLTNAFGRVRDGVAWADVTGLDRMEGQSLFMSFHRLEFTRRGAGRLEFLVLGASPALVRALLKEMDG